MLVLLLFLVSSWLLAVMQKKDISLLSLTVSIFFLTSCVLGT